MCSRYVRVSFSFFSFSNVTLRSRGTISKIVKNMKERFVQRGTDGGGRDTLGIIVLSVVGRFSRAEDTSDVSLESVKREMKRDREKKGSGLVTN